MMRYLQIYKRAIKKWGESAQLDQAIEECAELVAAIQHYRRGKVEKSVVLHELADVYLMVGQLAYMLGEEELNAEVENKISKLEALLASEG